MSKTKHTNVESLKTIRKYLTEQKKDLKAVLEIVSNLLIQVGVEHLEGVPANNTLLQEDLLKFVTEHRLKYGETIANATVFQGLIQLSWLEKGKIK